MHERVGVDLRDDVAEGVQSHGTWKVACRRWTTPVDVADHVQRVAEQGYTIVEDAIEPELRRRARPTISTGSSGSSR